MNSKDSEEPRRVNRRHAIDKLQAQAYLKTPYGANAMVELAQKAAAASPKRALELT
jgi:hypothetical protein